MIAYRQDFMQIGAYYLESNGSCSRWYRVVQRIWNKSLGPKSLISLKKLYDIGNYSGCSKDVRLARKYALVLERSHRFEHSSIDELMHTRVGALSLVRK